MLDEPQISIASNPKALLSWFKGFIASSPDACRRITFDPQYRHCIQLSCHALADLAYKQRDPQGLTAFHACLSAIYDIQFSSHISSDIRPVITDMAAILEHAMFEYEFAFVNPARLTEYPRSGASYVEWLKKLIERHPANTHSFYESFLRNQAGADDLRYFLAQETNLDPRFDDILAFLQIGTNGQAKMEIAKNYWDEMGNGNSKMVHTTLFSKALDALNVNQAFIEDNMLDEARVSGNLSAALALGRHYYFMAIGYFGVTEYIAPSRFEDVIEAWERNNLPRQGATYHKLHINIDAVHGDAWLDNVIAPAIDHGPDAGQKIALGALIRLNSSARYLDAMLDRLQTIDMRDAAKELKSISSYT